VPIGNGTVRRRVALLVAAPLAAVLALAAVVVVDRAERVRHADAVSHAMAMATGVGRVLDALQTEEIMSVGVLVGTQASAGLDVQSARVADQVADLEAQLGGGLPESVQAAVDAQGALSPIRQGVSSRTEKPADVVTAFSATIGSIIDSLPLAGVADTSTATGRQVLALDALLRIDALHAAGAADLLAASADRTEAAIVDYAATQRGAAALESQLRSYASPAQLSLYAVVTSAYVQRVGDGFVSSFTDSPRSTVATLSPDDLYPMLASYLQLGGLVEAKIIRDVTSAARHAQRNNQVQALTVAGFALLVLLVTLLLSGLGVRSIGRSVRGLAGALGRAADRSEVELRRVADDHVETASTAGLDELPISARSELGDIAREFARAQRGAAAVVERQAATRRNVSAMTETAGHRGAQLVARQQGIVDRLQRAESDPQILDELDRLDHLTSRLGRVTAALITLAAPPESGRHAADESGYVTPMALSDVIHLALDEIEAHFRVDVSVPTRTMVAPAVIDDVVLLLAELVANATAFSRIRSRVRVVAQPYDSAVAVIDDGIGMSDEQLAAVNARLANAERLDLASTGTLGLVVIGRLARRHDFRVTFEHTPGGGVTAVVDLGRYVLTTEATDLARASAPVPGAPRQRTDDEVYSTAGEAARYGPAAQLDSKPFNLEVLERATKVLGTGPTWNAFEVSLPEHAELPPGTSQPELPGRAPEPSVGPAGAGVPALGPDEHDDMPRAGTGFGPASGLEPVSGSGPTSGFGSPNGFDRPANGHGTGMVPTSTADRDGRGLFDGPDRPFAGMAHPFAGTGRPLAGRAPFDSGLVAGRFDGGEGPDVGDDPPDGTAFAGPFPDEAGFPAGGVARYVRPTGPGIDHSDAGDVAGDAAGDAAAYTAGRPLSRRVPGATRPPHPVEALSRFRTLDPEEARSLVEQFETGVARALGESASGGEDDEGHSR
jgi:signal transduction histidine kinase